MSAGLEGWFGEAFCAVVLPELRSIISSYVPLVPTFAECSDGITVLNRGRTVCKKGNDAVWLAALSACSVGELFKPMWRVSIEWSPDVQRLALVGVAKSLQSDTKFPTREMIGVDTIASVFHHNSNIGKLYGAFWKNSTQTVIFTIHCDLELGQIRVSRDGELMSRPIADNVPDLAAFRPHVELYAPGSTATFL